MKLVLALAFAAAIAACGVSASFGERLASAASPFDGNWSATLTGTATESDAGITGAPAQPCCASFAFTVTDGIVSSPAGSAGDLIAGTVSNTGTVDITLNTVALTGDPAFTNPVYFAHPCTFQAQFKSSSTAASVGTIACAAPAAGGFGGSFSGSFRAVRATVPKRQWRIVGLGDSLASGEGNPDKAKSSGRPAVWQDHRCDRSGYSFEAQVAQRLQKEYPDTPVTFVHLACSGATILNGLTGPYRGINPPKSKGDLLVSQVFAARTRLGNHTPDAVLVSAGVNDLAFGDVILFCAKSHGDCMEKQYKDNLTLRAWMARQIRLLPGHYTKLANDLAPLVQQQPQGENRVFVTEYPNSLTGDNGSLCGTKTILDFSAREIAWMYVSFLLPLNRAVAVAAGVYHWHLVNGPAAAFVGHGYCASPADSWIVSRSQSTQWQGNLDGTMHPNLAGQKAIADILYPALRDFLITAPALTP